jgi:hypothetical protein
MAMQVKDLTIDQLKAIIGDYVRPIYQPITLSYVIASIVTVPRSTASIWSLKP